MKHWFLYFLVIGICFASCKKDDDTANNNNNSNSDPYAENLALVTPGAAFYLIADVSGISGVSKINWQLSTVPGSRSQAYSGQCNGNECHTGYIVGHDVQPNYFWFVVLFQTTAASGFNGLVHTGDYAFCTPADDANGIDISYLDANYDEWRCKHINNNTLPASSFEVIKYETVNGVKHLEARFNCTLKQYSGNSSIVISNAVFKAHW